MKTYHAFAERQTQRAQVVKPWHVFLSVASNRRSQRYTAHDTQPVLQLGTSPQIVLCTCGGLKGCVNLCKKQEFFMSSSCELRGAYSHSPPHTNANHDVSCWHNKQPTAEQASLCRIVLFASTPQTTKRGLRIRIFTRLILSHTADNSIHRAQQLM